MHGDLKTCQQPPPLLTGAACTSAAAGQALPGAIQVPARPAALQPRQAAAAPRTRASTGSLLSSFSSRRRLEPLVDTENCGRGMGVQGRSKAGDRREAAARVKPNSLRQLAGAAAAQGTIVHCYC